jgi:hypothetical protein
MKHHLLLDVLDPDNCLFDCVQRVTAYRGYYNRNDCTFTRPKDNCIEVQETLDQDGDGLSGACKTDGEHTIGYCFHSLWGLWKSHLTVIYQMHHIRSRAGYWLHPYIEEEYAEAQEDRVYPSFYESLPKTLSEEQEELYQLHSAEQIFHETSSEARKVVIFAAIGRHNTLVLLLLSLYIYVSLL